jgi:RNA polymerase sigma factor (sigma-70 family)
MGTNSQTSDAEVIKLIQEGNSQGLALLYEGYRKEFVQWAVKFTKCEQEEAFDYYQASVLIVYENLLTGKVEALKSSIKTYLFSIGKNLAWQGRRQKARDLKTGTEYHLQLHLNHNNEEDLISEETHLELVSLCFNQLGDPCHSLLDLFYYKKKNMEEIAAALNYKNSETAKNQKYKCVERLRKMVEAELLKNVE